VVSVTIKIPLPPFFVKEDQKFVSVVSGRGTNRRIDDPAGAISVHGVCGAWGTLAAGIFNIGGTSAKIIGVQLLGMAVCFLWVFPVALLMFRLIDKTAGLRVSAEEELEGLDVTEHGGNASFCV